MEETNLSWLYEYYNNSPKAILRLGNRGEFPVRVKRRLSFEEAVNLVRAVCDGVVNPVTGEYHPEKKDFLLRVEVIRAYTDFPQFPEDEGECWEIVYGIPLFAMMTGRENRPVYFNNTEYDDSNAIDTEQYEQLLGAINNMIAQELQELSLRHARLQGGK